MINATNQDDAGADLPKQVAAAFSALPDAAAVVLGGSHQAGTMDDQSDIDLYVYAAAPISLGDRAAIAARFSTEREIGNEFWEPGDEWVHDSTGVLVDVMYRTPAWIEDQLERVLTRHEASIGYSTSLWHNVLHSVALFDRDGWYRQLQATASTPYPEPLRCAIVAKNHPILRRTRSSYLHQIEHALHRDDRVSVQHRVTALLASYFDVLFAINRLPHPGEKRLLQFVDANCPKAPPNFEGRVHALLAAALTPDVVTHINALVDDLDALLAAEQLIPAVASPAGHPDSTTLVRGGDSPCIERTAVAESALAVEPETTIRLQPDDAVDLHLHTLASDGAWTPAGLIDQLVEAGIKVAAVCDHDTQRSVLETMRRAERRGIHIIPGVEITTRWRDRQWHLLVYGIRPDRADEAAAPFRAVLAELDAKLSWLGEDARRRFEGSGRSLPSIEEFAGGRPLWPYHVLRAAIREGHAANLSTAAELTRQLGGDFNADLPLERVVEAVHLAGGICVMAHPGRGDSVGIMTEADLEAMLAEGIAIDGLEGHYRSYTDQVTAEYRDMATRHGLLISCGSDSHASKQPVDPRPWRAIWCADLLRRLGVEVAPLPDGAPVWEAGMSLATKPEPPAEPDAAAGPATNGVEPAAAEAKPHYV